MSDRARASVEVSPPTSHLTSSTRGVSVIESDLNGINSGIKDVISDGFLSLEAASRYLETFKTKLSPNFPFVVIPPNVYVDNLRQTKPFLLLTILASASYDDFSLQRLLGREVKKAVASRMILGGEISFDMLQGLLVFLAW